MNLKDYLNEEWVPALGCTEPASIAYAGAKATEQIEGNPTKIRLIVDTRIYKNCYAVGIPHSGHKTGIKWATAIGALLPNCGSKLQCFKDIDEGLLSAAGKLIESDNIDIEIDRTKTSLYIDFHVTGPKGTGRCLIEGTHTNIVVVEKNGEKVFENDTHGESAKQNPARSWASKLSPKEILEVAKNIDDDSRKLIRDGLKLNIKIAEHGLKLFPKSFVELTGSDPLTRISSLVCAGVFARMSGEDYPVMSVSGSGNKGITCSVPLAMIEKEWNLDPRRVEEALAIAMLFTSKTTEELGTLSAVCGCSNAAGIGLGCALVYLKGGGETELSHVINNMVGNVTGMICDGAKIGCALKTMTAVDTAFRATALAMSGIGIPAEDGIVGRNGSESLCNMGKIAKKGMTHTDDEILKIMEEKL